MKIGISNKKNIVPIIINMIWTLFVLWQFLITVPKFELQGPDGASYMILGLIFISGLIFFSSLVYILISNLYMKVKMYSDLVFVFIPIVVLSLIILFRL